VTELPRRILVLDFKERQGDQSFQAGWLEWRGAFCASVVRLTAGAKELPGAKVTLQWSEVSITLKRVGRRSFISLSIPRIVSSRH
jgi:hypothetical protein